MRLYKLTDRDGQTHGGTQWGEGIEHTAPGTGDLCSSGWIHAYTGSETDPGAGALLAVLLNPIHSDFRNPRLWEADGDVGKTDAGLKVGCTRLRTMWEIPAPELTTNQRVRFAVLCALATCPETSQGARFREWANSWLNGTDRSAQAGWSAEAQATPAACAAAWAARAAGVVRELDLAALARKAVGAVVGGGGGEEK